MRDKFFRVWLVPAVAGLAVSVVVNIAAWVGQTLSDPVFIGLHAAVFVVWLPIAVVCFPVLQRGFLVFQHDMWQVVLRGCPLWMRNGAYVVFAYAALSMVLSISNQPGATPRAGDLRTFSAFWILFHYLGTAILVSMQTLSAEGKLNPRFCPRGHQVSNEAFFCETCGARMPDRPAHIA